MGAEDVKSYKTCYECIINIEDLSVDTEREKEKRTTATIMEQSSDGLYEKQKNRRYGIR